MTSIMQFSEPLPTSFPARRPSDFQSSSISPLIAQAEELKRRKTHPLPLAAAHLYSRHPSPPRSTFSASDHPVPSVEGDCTQSPSPPPSPRHRKKYIFRDPRRRAAYLKARKERDFTPPLFKSDSGSERPYLPLRKQSAFIKDEDLLSQLEARADTPHVSEMLPGEDAGVQESAQEMDMPELGLDDEPFITDDEQALHPAQSSTSLLTDDVCPTCSIEEVQSIMARNT
ncbi:uncharacterized protein EI97DRAFT_457157 [Westerdykella ornata]|uniref:Uncharacterized protein n=1 Tax=Westerdykella ornata TaxID=318751 RepID=A0A6A6JMU5_WESOR|nr:uncharacterized protein EI97DRAFT_457157 [Westerdykella ornata]KAF2277921.1 hypothetical protein EI97DRAFT_457157 [Westerdykella ornata]